MDKVASLLPSTIEQATKGTPVEMLMKVVDRKNIEAFLAIELTKLASLINVDERLNLQGHQIPFIAGQLVDNYKNESLADFKICFARGAMGRYDDKLLRLDGAVINNWMAKYLEEKYQVIENKLMTEKENFYQDISPKRQSVQPENQASPERSLLSLLSVVMGSNELPPEVAKHLTPEQLKEVEESRQKGFKVTDSNNRKENEYERFKLARQFQNKLDRLSTELYEMKESYSEIKAYEDDNGFTVFAENEEDAIKIYELAKKETDL